ncbi:MAG TPA: methyl-accepting chemotaxis protein [Bacteroidales bacterium]|nr:methyl-accepting chemotaxis protein [Bacteroidales bacterium]
MGQLYLLITLLGVGNLFLYLKVRSLTRQNRKEKSEFEQNQQKIQEVYNEAIEDLQQKNRYLEDMAQVTIQTENAVMLMDAEGNITWVNEAFEKLYEYSFEEFTAKLGNNIRKTSFNPKIHERLKFCYTEKQPVTYEALNVTRSGREIWTHTSLIPLLNEENQVTGLVTIDSDVHKRIKTGEEMAEFIVSFNRQVEKMAEQVDIMVELTDALFERIDISQRRMNRTDQILSFIKEISDQIKILGINASIEAHAAGKSGAGFRVISKEIVNISNVILSSLNEINELVTGVRRTSEKLGTEKERSVQAIEEHRKIIADLRDKINAFECALMKIK